MTSPNVVPKMRRNGTIVELHPRQTAALRVVDEASPNAVNGTQPPKRVTNAERRPREHLSRDEVLALCKAARSNRQGARDAAAIWIAFNHGLRVGELADLRWSDVQWQPVGRTPAHRAGQAVPRAIATEGATAERQGVCDHQRRV
jgi:integrase